jgi:membrane protease YdiL (CAAX protease family)
MKDRTPENSSDAAPAASVDNGRSIRAHVIPFAAWIAVLHFLDVPAVPPSIRYLLQVVAGLACLAVWKPWRGYEGPRGSDVLPALAAGLAVLAVWVLPESPWMAQQFPAFHEFYARWLVGLWPPGVLEPAPDRTPFAPEVCGWPLALVRAGGSAFVIAPIEEFFWRSFVFRWALAADFEKIPLSARRWGMLLAVSFFFGVEHAQWFAGILAGLAYGGLMMFTGRIWAPVLAHGVTNLGLAVYVLMYGAYGFW